MYDALLMLALIAVGIVVAMRIGYRWGHANGVLRGRSEGFYSAWKSMGRKDQC